MRESALGTLNCERIVFIFMESLGQSFLSAVAWSEIKRVVLKKVKNNEFIEMMID